MAIPDPPPDPTHYQILLTDPEGSDAVELQRLLEDCGLRVLRVEELSQNEMELRTKKPSERAGALELHCTSKLKLELHGELYLAR